MSAKKYTCPKTGIEFEGEVVPKELGIIPAARQLLENTRQQAIARHAGKVQPWLEPRDTYTTPEGTTFHGPEISSRLGGRPQLEGGVFNFLSPPRGSAGRMWNKTVAGAINEWQCQAAENREAAARANKGRRYDPVTGTYY